MLTVRNLSISGINLNDTVSAALSMLKYEISKKKIVIKIEVEKNIGEINGDKVKLQQAFINIIYNAFKAVDVVGCIKINTFCLEKDSDLNLFGSRHSQW